MEKMIMGVCYISALTIGVPQKVPFRLGFFEFYEASSRVRRKFCVQRGQWGNAGHSPVLAEKRKGAQACAPFSGPVVFRVYFMAPGLASL